MRPAPGTVGYGFDLFAGGGGFGTAAEAVGIRIRDAVNHLPIACDTYKRNHPHVDVHPWDLFNADFRKLRYGAEYVTAGPSCAGHTKSKGKHRRHHDSARATAFCVNNALEYHRVPKVVVENVAEMLVWGQFAGWALCLKGLGYLLAPEIEALVALGPWPQKQVVENGDTYTTARARKEVPPEFRRRLEAAEAACVLDAADCGVPQHRERLFIVAIHQSYRREPLQLVKPALPHVPISTVLDFESGSWSPIHKPGRAAATIARIESGRKRHGARFVAPYYSSGSGLTGRSLDRPLGTISTVAGWILVDGDRLRMLTVAEYAAASSFPAGYWWPKSQAKSIHLIGNAVPPKLAEYVLRQAVAH